MNSASEEARQRAQLAVQRVDQECPVFYGLSLPELAVTAVLCLLATLPIALPTALMTGLWALPVILFFGTAGGIRLCAAFAERWRDGKPCGWLERQLAWQLRHWLLPASCPTDSGKWIPWRLRS